MIQDSQVLIRTPHDWVDYCLPEGLDLYGHLILATKICISANSLKPVQIQKNAVWAALKETVVWRPSNIWA